MMFRANRLTMMFRSKRTIGIAIVIIGILAAAVALYFGYWRALIIAAIAYGIVKA